MRRAKPVLLRKWPVKHPEVLNFEPCRIGNLPTAETVEEQPGPDKAAARAPEQSGHTPPPPQPPSSLCRPRWLLGLRLTLSYGYWSRRGRLRC